MGKKIIEKISSQEKILEAAITIFSQNGFDGARTRDIAALAKVNISNLHYYFVSKDKIYKAVIQKINDETNKHMMPTMVDQHQIIASSKNKKEIIEAIKTMAITFVLAITSPERKKFSKIIAFEQIEQSKHFRILFENVMQKVCEPFRLGAAKIMNKKVDNTEVILMTHTLMGMLSSFQHNKSSLMYVSGWKDYDLKNQKDIKKHIARTIDKLFFSYLGNV